MRIEGEFLPLEIARMAERIEGDKRSIERLEGDLKRRQEIADKGEALARRNRILEVLGLPDFSRAMQEFDVMFRRKHIAIVNLSRCHSRHTDLARERINSLAEATRESNEAMVKVQQVTPKDFILPTVLEGKTLEGVLNDEARYLFESFQTERVTKDLEFAKTILAAHEKQFTEAASYVMPSTRFRDFYRVLSEASRRALVQVVGGYRPKSETTIKEKDVYFPLRDRGLIEISRKVWPTDFGRALAEWIAEKIPDKGLGRGEVYARAASGLTKTFDAVTLERFRMEAQAALKEIVANPNRTEHFVFEATQGPASAIYKIPPTGRALRYFFGRIGGNLKELKAKRAIARLVPKEPAPYAPGRFVTDAGLFAHRGHLINDPESLKT